MSIASTDDFSDLVSVKSDSSYSGEAFEDLNGTIQKLTGEIEKLKGGVQDEEDILTSIIGSWRMVSSIGMKEYLANYNEYKRSGIWGACFETGLPNFSYDEESQKMTMFDAIGSQEHNKKSVKFDEKTVVNGTKEVTFVEDNSLVTVYFHENGKDEVSREKRYVKDGQLHIVSKRFGMKCTRAYEKALKMNYRTTESDGVKELRERFVKLEEEFEQQKEGLEKQLEMAQKNNELISEQLKQAIEKAEKFEENPDEFKKKIFGTWNQVDGIDSLEFKIRGNYLLAKGEDFENLLLEQASNKEVLKTIDTNQSGSRYSDTMAFSRDHYFRTRVFYFIGERLVFCCIGGQNPLRIYSKKN